MLVLGIDPGTARTGFGLVEESAGGELKAVNYGVITTAAGEPSQNRLLSIYESVQSLISEHRPDRAAIEKIYFQQNVSTALSVGQAKGVVLLAFSQAGLEVAEYTPLEVKQAIVGYGRAEKRQIQEMIQMLLSLESRPQPDDAADALAVAVCDLHMGGFRKRIEGEG
jgi:crossover junction endodeoxyribonuclease RuvC